ncbi:MAG: hypothetical protein ACXW08_03855, partial [Solirubrobacteraceae bacterium]
TSPRSRPSGARAAPARAARPPDLPPPGLLPWNTGGGRMSQESVGVGQRAKSLVQQAKRSAGVGDPPPATEAAEEES